MEEKSTVLETVAIDEEFRHLVTQPFKYDECGKTFNTRSDLRSHTRNDHVKKLLEMKVMNLKLLLSKQKFDVSDSILNLKEQEIKK